MAVIKMMVFFESVYNSSCWLITMLLLFPTCRNCKNVVRLDFLTMICLILNQDRSLRELEPLMEVSYRQDA